MQIKKLRRFRRSFSKIYCAVLVTVSATATVAAAAVFKISFGRQPAKFQRLADELVDGLMHVMHFLLGLEEAAGHRVAQQGFALFFKSGNFLGGQLRALLLLLEGLAFGHERLVLRAGFFVRDKRLNPLTGGTHFGLVQERLAQFPCLISDQAVLSRLHSLC